MNELAMELRRVDLAEGVLEGICAPYDETTFLAGDGRGERILRGAFRKTAREQQGHLKLFRDHDHSPADRVRPTDLATGTPTGCGRRSNWPTATVTARSATSSVRVC